MVYMYGNTKRTVKNAEAEKLHSRLCQPWCSTISRSVVFCSGVSSTMGDSDDMFLSWLCSSSSSSWWYTSLRLTEVSGGGSLCKTDIKCAVAVPDGKASCSSIIWRECTKFEHERWDKNMNETYDLFAYGWRKENSRTTIQYDRKSRETLCHLPEKGYRETPSYSS